MFRQLQDVWRELGQCLSEHAATTAAAAGAATTAASKDDGDNGSGGSGGSSRSRQEKKNDVPLQTQIQKQPTPNEKRNALWVECLLTEKIFPKSTPMDLLWMLLLVGDHCYGLQDAEWTAVSNEIFARRLLFYNYKGGMSLLFTQAYHQRVERILAYVEPRESDVILSGQSDWISYFLANGSNLDEVQFGHCLQILNLTMFRLTFATVLRIKSVQYWQQCFAMNVKRPISDLWKHCIIRDQCREFQHAPSKKNEEDFAVLDAIFKTLINHFSLHHYQTINKFLGFFNQGLTHHLNYFQESTALLQWLQFLYLKDLLSFQKQQPSQPPQKQPLQPLQQLESKNTAVVKCLIKLKEAYDYSCSQGDLRHDFVFYNAKYGSFKLLVANQNQVGQDIIDTIMNSPLLQLYKSELYKSENKQTCNVSSLMNSIMECFPSAPLIAEGVKTTMGAKTITKITIKAGNRGEMTETAEVERMDLFWYMMLIIVQNQYICHPAFFIDLVKDFWLLKKLPFLKPQFYFTPRAFEILVHIIIYYNHLLSAVELSSILKLLQESTLIQRKAIHPDVDANVWIVLHSTVYRWIEQSPNFMFFDLSEWILRFQSLLVIMLTLRETTVRIVTVQTPTTTTTSSSLSSASSSSSLHTRKEMELTDVILAWLMHYNDHHLFDNLSQLLLGFHSWESPSQSATHRIQAWVQKLKRKVLTIGKEKDQALHRARMTTQTITWTRVIGTNVSQCQRAQKFFLHCLQLRSLCSAVPQDFEEPTFLILCSEVCRVLTLLFQKENQSLLTTIDLRSNTHLLDVAINVQDLQFSFYRFEGFSQHQDNSWVSLKLDRLKKKNWNAKRQEWEETSITLVTEALVIMSRYYPINIVSQLRYHFFKTQRYYVLELNEMCTKKNIEKNLHYCNYLMTSKQKKQSKPKLYQLSFSQQHVS